MEAVYYGVPMIVTPTSSEQRMNGLIIEEKGMGFTMVKERNNHLSVGKMIHKILNTDEFYKRLNVYSTNYKNHINDFLTLDGFIDGIC